MNDELLDEKSVTLHGRYTLRELVQIVADQLKPTSPYVHNGGMGDRVIVDLKKG